ncbi:MAG: DUF2784 domain-containing protein [Cyclobacteriaceae bacterium]
MLIFLDYFFTVFHSAIVLFILLGWIDRRTRKAHLVLLGLVLIAWFVIGLYKGVLGYCPLTDWHWDIKRSLGERDIPHSFIEYMVEKITGIDFKSKLVDGFTLGGLIISLVMAGVMQTKKRLSKKPNLQ